jgi:hypothetical protein
LLGNDDASSAAVGLKVEVLLLGGLQVGGEVVHGYDELLALLSVGHLQVF